MPSPLAFCVRRVEMAGADGMVTVVTLRFPSDVRFVEEAVELITRHCMTGAPDIPQLGFRLRVALAEALSNAIVRGNREDQAKSVDVRAELSAGSIAVSVTDEGDGFDPTLVPEPTRPDRLEATGGRGLYLIRRLVDTVHFNPQGNSICMTLHRQ